MSIRVPSDLPRPMRLRLFERPAVVAGAAWLGIVLLTLMATCVPRSASANPTGFANVAHLARPVAVKAVGEPVPAPLIEIATTTSPSSSDAVFRRTSATAAKSLLGAALFLVAALNLCIVSHLKRVYVKPRRVGRRIKPQVREAMPSGLLNCRNRICTSERE